MKTLKRLLLAVALVAPFAMLTEGPVASAAPVWAPAATAAIHPGVQTVTDGAGQCTANFVYTDAGGAVYLGQAAHCSSTGTNTDTDGCLTGSMPIGTSVTIEGASRPGRLAYNSWLTMQAAGETNPDVCAFNDLALIQIDPADVGKVNPSVPHWGGPTALNTTGLATLDQIFSYGNSSLRFGITQLSPKTGVSNGDAGNGWSHGTTMVTPGIPGDSGSALLDSSGRAAGVLSTLGISLPGGSTNNFGDLSRELAYLNSHTSLGVSLALGTVAFNPTQVPLGI
jgi:hypothetical protein